MAENIHCDICGLDSHQAVLVATQTDGAGKHYCMRCFHALLHGQSPTQLRERWAEFKKTQQA
jgi:hypothetical protein